MRCYLTDGGRTRALYLTVGMSYGGLAADTTHPRVAILPTSTTLASLVPESLGGGLVFALPYHVPRRRGDTAPAAPKTRAFFPPLDGAAPLSTALKGTGFVEFPIVHVFAADAWKAAVDSGETIVMPLLESTKRKAEGDDGENKRAKVDSAAPAAAAAPVLTTGLVGLGDYDSEDEADEAENADVDAAAAVAASAAGDSGGDITLSPQMAAALGAALVADFGE